MFIEDVCAPFSVFVRTTMYSGCKAYLLRNWFVSADGIYVHREIDKRICVLGKIDKSIFIHVCDE